MSTIVKGDEYILPITINRGTTALTPSDVADVRIQVGEVLKTYSKNEITYNTTTNKWQYPLTQEETMKYANVLVPIQIGVKIGTEIRYSEAKQMNILDNIIMKEW